MPSALCGIAVLFLLSAPPGPQPPPALELWQAGQEALRRGQTERAIELYEQSLATDPGLTRNYLGLAAASLDRCEENRACAYLLLYVAAHPEHLAVRLQFAELLQRLHRVSEAQAEYRACVGEAQERREAAEQEIHCHSRLMQLAQETESDYDEHLHRGIGLYLVARQRLGCAVADEGDEADAEGLLCRAAAELTLARRANPSEARPCWYLHEVWSELAQSHPAARCLRAAEEAALFSDLTPAEKRRLDLACRQRDRTASPR